MSSSASFRGVRFTWPEYCSLCSAVVSSRLPKPRTPRGEWWPKRLPPIPELAKRMHVTGKVKLEVVIAANGTVKSARPVGGSPVFENSAVDAVKQWRFEAAKTETKAVIVLEFAD